MLQVRVVPVPLRPGRSRPQPVFRPRVSLIFSNFMFELSTRHTLESEPCNLFSAQAPCDCMGSLICSGCGDIFAFVAPRFGAYPAASYSVMGLALYGR